MTYLISQSKINFLFFLQITKPLSLLPVLLPYHCVYLRYGPAAGSTSNPSLWPDPTRCGLSRWYNPLTNTICQLKICFLPLAGQNYLSCSFLLYFSRSFSVPYAYCKLFFQRLLISNSCIIPDKNIILEWIVWYWKTANTFSELPQ